MSQPTPTDTPARASAGRLGGLAVYGERRVFVMLLLGFAAGLPNLLIFDTLSAWLRESGLTLSVIGFFALATLSYSLKFVWAPLVDRTAIPLLTPLLGHRRSWMLVTQAVVIFGLWSISGLDPSNALVAIALFATLVGFFGATQDIVIDAWRIEAADDSRHGAMAAAYQMGYRVAMIVASAKKPITSSVCPLSRSQADRVSKMSRLGRPAEKPSSNMMKTRRSP